MQDTVRLVDPDAESFEKRDVADNDAKSDGQQQQRFVFFGDGKIDKDHANTKHDNVSIVRQVEPGVGDKLKKQLHILYPPSIS